MHHDISLPAFPLCLSWLDCNPAPIAEGETPGLGSYLAVGTFNPAIEIWNLDVMDVLEPVATLGGLAPEPHVGKRSKKGKKGRKKAPGPVMPALLPGSHEDAVLGLGWNREHRHLLASASADRTVKLWDINSGTPVHTFTHHTDKVQCVAWNPAETTIMATGAFGGEVAILDATKVRCAGGVRGPAWCADCGRCGELDPWTVC